VLRNNYLQTLALSLERRGARGSRLPAAADAGAGARGELDRAVELPARRHGARRARERRGEPLTRPELAVLLAYAKLSLYDDLLDSACRTIPISAASWPLFPRRAARALPDALREPPAAPRDHRDAARQLDDQPRRPAFVGAHRRPDRRLAASIAAAFAAVRNSYGMPALNDEIDALDGKVGGGAARRSTPPCRTCCIDRLVWFLRNVDNAGNAASR
jgi:glutamate dehydrogenase